MPFVQKKSLGPWGTQVRIVSTKLLPRFDRLGTTKCKLDGRRVNDIYLVYEGHTRNNLINWF